MGLAASQARLLTITARLADNELRSQTINNAKMRLATQSAQASDEYVSALNNAQMMFSNIGTDGLTQKQALTFNALTQYSQYNNQYGVVDSAGKILVSEEDAAIFKSHSRDLEGFLKAHGLEWETTFFDDDTLQNKLSSFYSGDDAYIANLLNQSYNGKSGSAALKERYLDALSQDASIERLNYEIYSQQYYQQLINMYDNTIPQFRYDLFDDSVDGVTEEEIANAICSQFNNARGIVQELTAGQTNPGGAKKTDGTVGTGATAAYSFANISKYLNQSGRDKIGAFVSSLRDEIYPSNGRPVAGYQCDGGPVETKNRNNTLPLYDSDGEKIEEGYPENCTEYKFHRISIVIDGPVAVEWVIGEDGQPDKTKPTRYENKSYIQLAPHSSRLGWYYGSSGPYDADKKVYINPPQGGDMNKFIMDEMAKVKEEFNDGDSNYVHSFQVATDPETGQPDYSMMIILNAADEPREDTYKDFILTYFEMILDCEGYFNPEAYAADNTDILTLAELNNARNRYYQEYGFTPSKYEYLIDFEKLIQSGSYGSSDAFNSVLNSWLVDKMLDVLGEPKYAWVDKTDSSNTGNADAKAQWLTNLFNRMQKGYKVLENGLAKSQEWLEYAFESGLVSMEQVDLSYNWISMDYKTCSNIYEETDNSATVAKAEAKYNRAMNDIKQKDQMFDMQLKNIDTEHSSLQTEYDVIKNVMNKNIERTMKFDQNG